MPPPDTHRLPGRLIRAGTFIASGEEITGVVIEIPRDTLHAIPHIPLLGPVALDLRPRPSALPDAAASLTPRTDALAPVLVHDPAGQPYQADLVPAEFARTLELELANARRALADAQFHLEEWQRNFEAWGDEPDEALAKLTEAWEQRLAAIHQDSARIDWLCQRWESQSHGEQVVSYRLRQIDGSFRSAIDSAMTAAASGPPPSALSTPQT